MTNLIPEAILNLAPGNGNVAVHGIRNARPRPHHPNNIPVNAQEAAAAQPEDAEAAQREMEGGSEVSTKCNLRRCWDTSLR